MITMPTKNKTIQLRPLPREVVNKLLNHLHETGSVMIAGVQWMHDSTYCDESGLKISLCRPGSDFLEQVAHQGTYIRKGKNDTMTVSANTLATMLGLTEKIEDTKCSK